MSIIFSAVYNLFDQPENGLGWNSREGGWQGAAVIDDEDLISDHMGLGESKAFEDIVSLMTGQQWTKKEFYGLDEYERMLYSWSSFVRKVKYEKRYLFYTDEGDEYDHEILSAGDTLAMLGRTIQELSLIATLDKGSTFFRARYTENDDHFTSAEQLGPPTPENAKYPNRMSAAGIPMFYGARKLKTCLLEVATNQLGCFTRSKWTTCQPINVLDLTEFIKGKHGWRFAKGSPSIFDKSRRHLRPAIKFLADFMSDFTALVKKDGREHIEYVPTQIVAEYLRWGFALDNDEKLGGILYPSSKNSEASIVLFAGPDECKPEQYTFQKQLLRLDESYTRKLTSQEVAKIVK